MVKVTLIIETPAGSSTHVETSAGHLVVPLVLRTAHAAMAARPGELAALETVGRLLGDFLRQCPAPPVPSRGGG